MKEKEVYNENQCEISNYGMEFLWWHGIRETLMGLIPALISLPKEGNLDLCCPPGIVVHDWLACLAGTINDYTASRETLPISPNKIPSDVSSACRVFRPGVRLRGGSGGTRPYWVRPPIQAAGYNILLPIINAPLFSL